MNHETWHRDYQGAWRLFAPTCALELYLYREPDIPRGVSYKLHLTCLNGAFFDRAVQVGSDIPPPTLKLDFGTVLDFLDASPGAVMDDILKAFLTTWELMPGLQPGRWIYEAKFYLKHVIGARHAETARG